MLEMVEDSEKPIPIVHYRSLVMRRTNLLWNSSPFY